MSLLSSSHQELKIQREVLVANGSLGAFHIFCNVAPFSADPITGCEDVTFSARSPSWQWWQTRCRNWLCPFTGCTQEPLLLIQKAPGRFHRTWQHKLAEIWLDKNRHHNTQHWKQCNQVDLIWLEENRLVNNCIYIFTKTTNEFHFSMFWPAEQASLALMAHHCPGIYICSVLSFILSCTQKLCDCATSPMQKRDQGCGEPQKKCSNIASLISPVKSAANPLLVNNAPNQQSAF